MSMELSRRQRVRTTTLFALACYLLAFFAQWRHQNEVSHTICEHGEWVHVENARIDHSARGAEHGPVVESGSAHSRKHEHEHCSLARPGPSTQGPGFLRLVHCATTTAAVTSKLLARAPDASRTPRYLLAPHHSPPHV